MSASPLKEPFALLRERFIWAWEDIPLSERVTNPANGRYPGRLLRWLSSPGSQNPLLQANRAKGVSDHFPAILTLAINLTDAAKYWQITLVDLSRVVFGWFLPELGPRVEFMSSLTLIYNSSGAFGTAEARNATGCGDDRLPLVRTCAQGHIPANTRCGGVRTNDVAESLGDTLSADISQTFSGDA